MRSPRLDSEIGSDDTVAAIDTSIDERINESAISAMNHCPYSDRLAKADTQCLRMCRPRLDVEISSDDTITAIDPCVDEGIDESAVSVMYYSSYSDRLTCTDAECLCMRSPRLDSKVSGDDTVAAIDSCIDERIDESAVGAVVYGSDGDRLSKADTQCLRMCRPRLDGEISSDDTITAIDPCIDECINECTIGAMNDCPYSDGLSETNADRLTMSGPGLDNKIANDNAVATTNNKCISINAIRSISMYAHCDRLTCTNIMNNGVRGWSFYGQSKLHYTITWHSGYSVIVYTCDRAHDTAK